MVDYRSSIEKRSVDWIPDSPVTSRIRTRLHIAVAKETKMAEG